MFNGFLTAIFLAAAVVPAELIKVRDQTQIWADTYEQDLSGFGAVQSEVAQSVATALALKLLPTEQTRLASAGRYDEAIVEAKKALELEPDFSVSYGILARAYSEKGMHNEALDAARRLTELDPEGGKVDLIVAYVAAGQRDQALAIAPGLDKNFWTSAWAYLALGDKDTALQILEAAYKGHQSTLPWVRMRGGGWDAIYDDPRFQDLVRRMNLPPAGGRK
jgi:tetratricopeptide (TPR) repeat protein